jgi:hypothetical protein
MHLTLNSSTPSAASSPPPIIRQRRSNVSPEAPRVVIESTERIAISGDSSAPSHH